MTMCNPAHDGAHVTGADNEIAATKICRLLRVAALKESHALLGRAT